MPEFSQEELDEATVALGRIGVLDVDELSPAVLLGYLGHGVKAAAATHPNDPELRRLHAMYTVWKTVLDRQLEEFALPTGRIIPDGFTSGLGLRS